MHARQDGWTFFTWPVKWGETSTALKQQQRDTERGQCHAHFAPEKRRRRWRLSMQWDMLHFLQQLQGKQGKKANWAWPARFAPADCKISDLRSCGLRDKMQSVVDPVHCTPLPHSIAILCLYNLSIHQAHNKAIKATLDDANPIKANLKQLQLYSNLNPKPISISICNLETPHRSPTSTRLKLKLKLSANLSSSAKFLRIANGSNDDDDA